MIVKWHRQTRQDLWQVRVYIAKENPKAAARVAGRILQAVGRLSENPWIGRPDRVIDTRELTISGTPYLIPYTVAGDAAAILRVLHGARQWPGL